MGNGQLIANFASEPFLVTEFMNIELSDGLVGIRRFRPEDVPLLFAAVRESINELSTSLTWCQVGCSIEQSAAFVSACDTDWEKGERYTFMIFDIKDHTFLGSVGLNHINRTHGFANLDYWVRSSRTHQGIASAAVRLLSRFGLHELGFNRIEIIAGTRNRPSQRVAEKAGAKREGILRNKIMLHGMPHDAVLYSLIAQDE